MSMLYDPYDDETFLILEGDEAKYLDIAATAGTFDPLMMAPGYDDSAWASAPQPFVLNNNGHFTGSVWDAFGVEFGGPFSPAPPAGYTSPNPDRFAGTPIGDGGTGFAEIAARFTYTVPAAGIPAPFDTDATDWLVMHIWAGRQVIYLDGAALPTFTGSGRAGQHPTSLFNAAIAPGAHVLGLHGQGTAANFALFSVLFGVGTIISSPEGIVRQRQIPGNVRQRQHGGVVRQRQVPR